MRKLVVLDPEHQRVLEQASDFSNLTEHGVRSISDLHNCAFRDHIVFHIDRNCDLGLELNFSGHIIDLDIFELVLSGEHLERFWACLEDHTQLDIVLIQNQFSSEVIDVVHALLEILSVKARLSVRVDLLLDPQIVDQHCKIMS